MSSEITTPPLGMAAHPARELRADPFHAGVRLASLGGWLAAVSGVYFIGAWVWGLIFGDSQSWFWLPWLIITLFLSQPLARRGERWLQQHWSSGRTVRLASGSVTMREKAGDQPLNLAHKVNYWRWHFQIRDRRGGRVPNGHHCYALRLVQDDHVVNLYTFLAPGEAEKLTARWDFYEIRRASANDAHPPARAVTLGGRDATYLSAEHERWERGAELTPADFEALLAHLDQHLPAFAAAPTS